MHRILLALALLCSFAWAQDARPRQRDEQPGPRSERREEMRQRIRERIRAEVRERVRERLAERRGRGGRHDGIRYHHRRHGEGPRGRFGAMAPEARRQVMGGDRGMGPAREQMREVVRERLQERMQGRREAMQERTPPPDRERIRPPVQERGRERVQEMREAGPARRRLALPPPPRHERRGDTIDL